MVRIRTRTPDCAGSWKTQAVDEHQWRDLGDALRRGHVQVLAAIGGRSDWDDPDLFKGTLALIGHGAYHLGAIRQIARTLKA